MAKRVKMPSKAALSRAGRDLRNKRTREKRETQAARLLARARWARKR